MKRTRRRQSKAEKAAHERFRSEVMALQRKCWLDGCGAKATDPHHIIPKTFLKAHTSTLEDEARWQVVHDPRNGVPVCSRCHSRITSRFRPLLRYEVPDRAREFAEEQGITWKLSKECPDEADFFFGRDAA